MVHGQAIGIPFRRRKGEQAPPPPKEVAWNPTIESILPYKEVKYLKFVEGAGWQALNIGEILSACWSKSNDTHCYDRALL